MEAGRLGGWKDLSLATIPEGLNYDTPDEIRGIMRDIHLQVPKGRPKNPLISIVQIMRVSPPISPARITFFDILTSY
jgi:hypothetical protein